MRDFFAENVIDWKIVDKFEREGTISGYCMALAECDKLLNFLLSQEGYIGINTADRVKKARERFANFQELFRAIEIKANVFEKYEEAVSIQELKDAIRIYRESINDFVQGQIKESTPWERFISFLESYFLSRPGFLANFLVGFLILIILILVLDSTHFGQKFIHVLADFFRAVLPVMVILVIILGVLMVLTILILLYSGKRKSSFKEQLRKIRTSILTTSSRLRQGSGGQIKSKNRDSQPEK